MKTALYIMLIAAVGFFNSCNNSPAVKDTEERIDISDSALIKKGEHLVMIAGCNDCHSPKHIGQKGPEIIPEKMLSGYPSERLLPKFDTTLAKCGIAQMNEDMTAAAGPWGISFASNLTGDATGAGS